MTNNDELGGITPPTRTPADNAQLALLCEVAGTPKPGNVDRERDLEDLRFEHFLAGAVGAGSGLRRAERGATVGVALERAVAGMSQQSGGNTQFGCLLLLVPLIRASVTEALSPAGVTRVVTETTVADAVNFYRAFEHVDVTVDAPPPVAADLDVRRGAAAIPAVRRRELTLADIMGLSLSDTRGIPDGNAKEWVEGFPRTFETAESILSDHGPIEKRVARAFLDCLAAEPDTLVAITHGPEVAREVSTRAATINGDLDAATDLATEFVAAGINPGTTADLISAAVYVALERGLDI